MLIKSVHQEKVPTDDGLPPLALFRLRRIVVLAGANGSGKSRILRRVLKVGDIRQPEWNKGLEIEGKPSAPIKFVSEELRLSDPAEMTQQRLIEFASRAETPGASHLGQTTIAYIQRVQSQAWHARHQESIEPQEVKDLKIDVNKSLEELIKTVMGVDLSMDGEGNTLIFGMPIAKASLSDGQCALLQWCAALHAQGDKLNELVLVMDEPETHLHPDSMIATIERIIDANSDGQIWIATHSVSLISALYKRCCDDLSLYFMNEGSAQYSGEQPEQILRSLLGGQDNIEAMREFIDLPEVFATNRFASQCLLEPSVLPSQNPRDHQVGLVSDDCATPGEKLRILDFGCGKARVLEAMLANHEDALADRLDYVGWDISNTNRLTCEGIIERAYGSSENRWFNNRDEFSGVFEERIFDRVLMCNVLHEISPVDWVKCFCDTSIIRECLKQDGKLLIIEDHLMPRGEYAHPFGFIVLNTRAIKELFDSKGSNQGVIVRKERDGRVKGHWISASLMENVTQRTVVNALQAARDSAKEEIVRIRSDREHNFKTGRAHGFWVQQYCNTTLALQELDGSRLLTP